jgi:P-type Cu+ transporter
MEAVLEKPQIDNKCYHCGDDCGSSRLFTGNKHFCCDGCQMVYEILNQNGLCTYYDIDKNPGIKIKTVSDERYAYLDDEEVHNKVLDFYDGHLARITLYIPAIHCSSCIWLLENLYKLKEGIDDSRVNFLKKEAYITFNEEKISLRKLVETLASIGYAPEINLDRVEKRKKKSEDKSIFYKIGVAGFCFGNIMLLSFPEYLGMSEDTESAYKVFFGYINILLALPVLLYCSRDFFISAYQGLKHKIISIDVPIAVGIVALFVKSTYEILTHTGSGYMDSLAALLFFLLLGKWYQGKTYAALSFERDYQSYFPVAITKIQKDAPNTAVPVNSLKPGDQILIRSQEIIPADSVLVKGQAMIDYSFVTGESVPVRKEAGEKMFAGGRQTGSSIEAVIQKEVSQSYLIQLWNNDVFSKEKKKDLSGIALVLGRNFTVAVLLISIATTVYWNIVNPSVWIHAVTSVLIVACPCALALTIPVSFGNVLRYLGRTGFFLKNSEVVEKLATADTIVFDKTGTITETDDSEIIFHGEELSLDEKILVKSLSQHSTHPMSVVLQKYFSKVSSVQVENFSEEPGKGISGIVYSNLVKLGSARFTGGITDKNDLSSKVYVNINGLNRGYFKVSNKYRSGIQELLSELQENYEVHLLSGDNSSEKGRLMKFFRNPEHLQFNQSPEDKLNYIKSLQNNGKKVIMLGDGLNDAGALKQADAGITVAKDIYSFSPACDAILDASKLAQLKQMLAFSKAGIRSVRLSLMLSLMYNIVGISFAVSGALTPLVAAVLMPLSSVTVVGFISVYTAVKSRKIN